MITVEEFLKQTSQLNNEQDLFACFENAIQSYGIDFSCYFINKIPTQEGEQAHNHIHSSFPDDWVEHYIEENYIEIDPIQIYGRTSKKPFKWFELPEMMNMSDESLRYLKHLYNAGFKDGTMIPIFGPAGEVGTMGLSKKDGKIDLSPEEERSLQMICFHLHNMYTELNQQGHAKLPQLSARERDVLQWAAKGKSNTVIGDIIGISEHTVDTYMRRCYQKLGTSNRISTVVKAISLGLIIP